jgi:bifunctional polynucleotide phosphatase/kinase
MLTSDLHQKTNRESRTILPHVAFSGFASRYREPKLSEGFADIIKTDFKVRVIQDFPRRLSCRNVTWANQSVHCIV